MQDIAMKDAGSSLFSQKNMAPKASLPQGAFHPKLRSMFDKKNVSNEPEEKLLSGLNNEKNSKIKSGITQGSVQGSEGSFLDILANQMQTENIPSSSTEIPFFKSNNVALKAKPGPNGLDFKQEQKSTQKISEAILNNMNRDFFNTSASSMSENQSLEQLKYEKNTLESVKKILSEIANRDASKEAANKKFFISNKVNPDFDGKLDLLGKESSLNDNFLNSKTGLNPQVGSMDGLDKTQSFKLANNETNPLQNLLKLSGSEANSSSFSSQNFLVAENNKDQNEKEIKKLKQDASGKKQDIDFNRIQMELSKSVPLSQQTSGDVGSLKIMDISYLGNNTQNIINKIENYIMQSAVANEKSMGIVFQHDQLGSIGVNVEKMLGKELKISILTMNKDSNEFFITSKNNLLKDLNSNGIQVKDFTVENFNSTQGIQNFAFDVGKLASDSKVQPSSLNASFFNLNSLNSLNPSNSQFNSSTGSNSQNSQQQNLSNGSQNSYEQYNQQNERNSHNGSDHERRKAMWEYYQNKEYV